MADYQILVSVQIESDEIRLLAGEFFSDRLNVLGKKEVACAGLFLLQNIPYNSYLSLRKLRYRNLL